jgi:DNA-binding beta-propeller fold protein YncE
MRIMRNTRIPFAAARVRAALTAVLAAAVLAAGCASQSERSVRRTYEAYRTAVENRDLAALRTMVVSEKAGELDGPQAQAVLEVLTAMMPASPVVQSVEVEDAKATITLESSVAGQTMEGAVTLVREGGDWKVDEEGWDISAALSGSGDWAGRLRAGGEAKPRPRFHWAGHADGVTRIAFTEDGNRLVTIGYGDQFLRVWDRWSGSLVDERHLDNRPADLAVLSDGTAAVVDAKGNVTLWPLDYSGLGEPSRLRGDAGQTPRIAASADGRLLATTAWNMPVQIWSIAEGRVTQVLGKSIQMRGISFSPRGKTLVTGGYDDTFSIWDLESKGFLGFGGRKTVKVPKVDKQSDVTSVAWSPDGEQILTGHMDSSVTLWEASKRKEVLDLYVPDASTYQVAFSPDGTLFASAQQDGTVYLWDAGTGDRLAGLASHQGAVTAIAFSPVEGEILASGGEDGQVVIWQ